MDAKSIIPPSPTRPRPSQTKAAKFARTINSIQANFSLSTILLIGATLQTILILILPARYALTPAVFLLIARTLDTALITYGFKPNPYLKNMLPKKTTAQVMSKDGTYAGPGKEKIAVLLLGAKSNHPLGVFAPDYNIVGDYLQKMTDELESDPTQDTGFLGQTGFIHQDANGANELLFLSYWRTLEDVHRYAHGPTHLEAWKWWEKTLKKHDYIGFMHEVYEADRGSWETVYINFQPTDLGATTYLKKDGKLQGGKVGSEWMANTDY
ncbi:hypothetical protein B7494_g6542 [Chlorociboria aeruginascens]|nr:hypothetical protein B7494_g6542 [Chlorociboria aeruginascens]